MCDNFVSVERVPQEISDILSGSFDEIFDHIKDIGNKKVVVYNKDMKEYYSREIFRHYKSFGYTPGFKEIKKSYMFGEKAEGKAYMFGETQDATAEYVEPELDVLKKLLSVAHEVFGNATWNLYINAYNPEDYIEFHSDCINSIEDNTDIILMSMYEPGATERILNFVHKIGNDKFDIPLGADTLVKMNSDKQTEWRHAIGPGAGRRLGLTFRRMKE